MAIAQRLGERLRASLDAILPISLFFPGLPRISATRINVTSHSLDQTAREIVEKVRRPVALFLDPKLALSRRVQLPRAVGAKMETAITLQLRQTMPGQGQGLVWSALRTGRKGATEEYIVYMVRQGQIDDCLLECRSLGASVESVSIDVPNLRPIWQSRPKQEAVARKWQAFSVLMVALIALVASLRIEIHRQAMEETLASRAEYVAALEQRLTTLQSETDTKTAKGGEITSDVQILVAQSQRLKPLADLTSVLPDTVWISELAISGDQLVLSGFASGEVTEVVGQVQTLPWVLDVALDGAVARDSTSGQSRFDLRVSVGPVDPR